jgi:SAM-dependent methyltransferase
MSTGATDARSAAGVVAINHDDRDRLGRALHKARVAAYPPGEFVGQESFMRASDILRLAERAGVGPDTSVLDLCCGIGGPGLLIARHFGCRYRGVDASASAVRIARSRAADFDCRFDVASIPPLPDGGYDVVLLFETMLAFPDKRDLLRHVAAAMQPRGRFVFTVEEGEPLTDSERTSMPESATVWLTPLPELQADLRAAGMSVTLQVDCSHAHQTIAQRLYDAFSADSAAIEEHLGREALDSLLTSHRLWSDWLRSGRVRKFAMVAGLTGA